jgi:hypothetical protein
LLKIKKIEVDMADELDDLDYEQEEWAEEYETWCSPESEIFSGLEAGSTSFDTIEKDFAMLTTKPGAVGTEPRASISK